MKSPIEQNNEDTNTDRRACCGIATTKSSKPLIYGSVAALIMLGFYLGLITLTSDWYNAKAQFNDYRWWVIALALGLGLQVGLFTRMRQASAAAHLKGAASGMAASGGVSGVAMALCCSHYLAGLLPLIGLPFLSTAVAGLDQYQTQFFLVGVISNFLGLTYILWIMSKNDLLPGLPVIHTYLRRIPNKQEKQQ